MEFDLESAHLNLLAVDPIFRRRGIARSLLSWLEKSAKTAGILEITLEVRTMNTGAQNSIGSSDLANINTYDTITSRLTERRSLPTV